MTHLELAEAEWWYMAGGGSAGLTPEEREKHEVRLWTFLLMAAEWGELDWYCPLCRRPA